MKLWSLRIHIHNDVNFSNYMVKKNMAKHESAIGHGVLWFYLLGDSSCIKYLPHIFKMILKNIQKKPRQTIH